MNCTIYLLKIENCALTLLLVKNGDIPFYTVYTISVSGCRFTHARMVQNSDYKLIKDVNKLSKG